MRKDSHLIHLKASEETEVLKCTDKSLKLSFQVLFFYQNVIWRVKWFFLNGFWLCLIFFEVIKEENLDWRRYPISWRQKMWENFSKNLENWFFYRRNIPAKEIQDIPISWTNQSRNCFTWKGASLEFRGNQRCLFSRNIYCFGSFCNLTLKDLQGK